MSSTFISRFTPSLMTPDTLEALFIQRDKLAEQVLDDIRHSAASKAKHYHLLIGPRGLGKTHFVTLIFNRIKTNTALMKRLRIAWLREEERGISSFLELLMRILNALVREYPDDGLLERMQALYDQSPKQAERMAQEILTEYLGKRTLLLLVENLDSIFIGLKEPGQQALRAYLQEKANCAILATSTALFNGVSLQRSPFYGFFNIHHLRELTLEEAIELLAHLAEARQDQELTDFIRTPTGRARIRAIHHLAGGNHRIYVVFSEFLTRESLDELVTPFMRMLDDLTPYYQGRLDLLSPLQQQIVAYLAHAGGAQTVKAIARQCFTLPQTAATQLRFLKERGFLQTHTPQVDKRETYYELREPLMRLCFEVKEYRGGPIRLFVDFLRNWYSREELKLRLEVLPDIATFTRDCIQEAISQLEREDEDPKIKACLVYLDNYIETDDRINILNVAEELITLRGEIFDWRLYGYILLLFKDANKALSALDAAITLDDNDYETWYMHAIALQMLNRIDEALRSIDIALSIDFTNIAGLNEKVILLSIKNELLNFNSTIDISNKILDNANEIIYFSENPSVLYWLCGMFQSRIKQFDAAIQSFENAIQIQSTEYYVEKLLVDSPISSISHITSNDILPSQRGKWLQDWIRITGNQEKSQSALAVLAATVQYLNTGDDRALLELPQEQRKLVLEQLADNLAGEGDTGNTTK